MSFLNIFLKTRNWKQIHAKKFLILISLTLVLSACGSDSEVKQSTVPKTEVTNSNFSWNCKTDTDALGSKSISCFSHYNDEKNGMYWTLTLLCDSESVARHSITGIYSSNYSSVYFPSGEDFNADVRVGNKPIENWSMYSWMNGTGAAFKFSGLSQNQSTYKILREITNSDTFAFRSRDNQNFPISAIFQVSGTTQIAASFAAIGCGSDK